MDGPSVERLLTIEELSAKSRLSRSTIHRLKRAGKIPFFQPAGKGGRLLFPADAVEQMAAASGGAPPQSTAKPAKGDRLSGRPPRWTQALNEHQER